MTQNKDLPAFANPGSEYGPGSGGLTKREYFAAEAMKSFILNKNISTWQALMNQEGIVDDIAGASIALADALLKQFE